MANILTLNLVQNVWGALFGEKEFSFYVSNPSGESADISTLNQKLATLSILDMQPTPAWTYPLQPTENGLVVKDTRIRMPITITARIALPTAGGDDYLTLVGNAVGNILSGSLTTGLYAKVYKTLQTIIDNNYVWTITTKLRTYENMYLSSLPTNFTPETNDRVIVTLNFVENIIPSQEGNNVADPKDEDTSYFTKITNELSNKWETAKNNVASIGSSLTGI